jgi:hypothetical protein
MLQKTAVFAWLLGASLVLAQPPAKDPVPPKTTGPVLTGSGSSTLTLTGVTTTSSSGTTAKKLEPGSLEEMLDKALRNNPDILAAEAKVREAEAECNRVRHQVVAKIVGLRMDIENAKKTLAIAESMLKLELDARSQRSVVLPLQSNVEKQKAELGKLEAELKAVLGSYAQVKNTAFDANGVLPLYSTVFTTTNSPYWVPFTNTATLAPSAAYFSLTSTQTVQTPMAERIKAALDKTVSLDEFPDARLKDVLGFLTKKAGVDVPFRMLGKTEEEPVSLMNAELPLGAWLQAIEDSVPNLRFVVREYGILATTKDRIPDGAITVQEFWRQGAKAKTPAPKSGKEPEAAKKP